MYEMKIGEKIVVVLFDYMSHFMNVYEKRNCWKNVPGPQDSRQISV